MSGQKQGIHTDLLFVGLTRPATILGVPYIAVVLELIVVSVLFINVSNPLYLLLLVPIHGVLYLISANDPGAFSAIFAWTITIGRCRNKRFWGAASFSPLAVRKWKK